MPYSTRNLSISSILFPSLNSSLEGISADLFFRGCRRHCPGCHNLELQTFQAPNKSAMDVVKAVQDNQVKILTLMGGEPLDVDHDALINLLEALKELCPDLRINLYTGYELEEVPEDIKSYVGSIKTGMYDETKLNKRPCFLASSNQRYYQRNSAGEFVQLYPAL